MTAKKSSSSKSKSISKKDLDIVRGVVRKGSSITVRKIPAAKKSSVAFARVIMDPVVKPKHFSVSDIRDAVRTVASSKQ